MPSGQPEGWEQSGAWPGAAELLVGPGRRLRFSPRFGSAGAARASRGLEDRGAWSSQQAGAVRSQPRARTPVGQPGHGEHTCLPGLRPPLTLLLPVL